MSFMGVDLGTNGVKIVVISEEGKIIHQNSDNYTLTFSKGLRAELNPMTIWSCCSQLIADAVIRLKTKDPVESIAFSVLGEAITPVDKIGKPLYNTLVSMDYRGKDQAIRLSDRIGKEEIYYQTGQHNHPMYPVNKILWWRDNSPDLFNKVWKFLCWEDYVSFKLTGIPLMSYSLASRTMLFNITTKKWSRELLGATFLSEDLFSGLVPPGKPIGTLQPASLNNPGIPKNITLVSGGWDQACAALGSGITNPDHFLVSIGTTICAGFYVDKLKINKTLFSGGYATNCYLFNDSYFINGGALDGGELLNWYRDGLKKELAEKLSNSNLNFFEHCLKTLDFNPSPLFFLPFFSGAGSPTPDPNLKGGIFGLSYQKRDEDILKAIIESICFVVKENLSFIEKKLRVNFQEIRFVGGVSRSTYISTLLSTILKKKVITFNFTQNAAYGAAILALVGLKGWNTGLTVLHNFLINSKQFLPNDDEAKKYDLKYSQYLTMVKKLCSVLKNLSV
jgi:xylulokinase